MKIKKIIMQTLKKAYYLAFSASNCIVGENSRVTIQGEIFNPSSCKANISIGKNTTIAGSLLVWANAGKIEIGDWSFVGENTRIFSAKRIRIGSRVQIAHGCNIYDCNIHSINADERHKEYVQNITGDMVKLFPLNEKDVIIEDDAWLGACVIVLKGVTIGKGAIVGAGSVVTQDIPDYTIVVGNPARIIRTIEP